MEFKIEYSVDFIKSFKANFNEDEIKQIKDAIRKLVINPREQSLHTRRIENTKDIYEGRANKEIRIGWRFNGKGIIQLIYTNHHKEFYDFFDKGKYKKNDVEIFDVEKGENQ